MSKILWIDDNEDMAELVRDELALRGHEVSIQAMWNESQVTSESFDLIIVDLYLETVDPDSGLAQTHSGLFHLLQQFEKDPEFRRGLESGAFRCLLLSQHLAEFELRESIKRVTERSRIRAFLRSKNEKASEFASRREAMAEVIEEVLASAHAPLLASEVEARSKIPRRSDYFSMPLREFRQMPEFQQAELQEDAIRRVSAVTKEAFKNQDVDWVMYCGNPRRAIDQGTSPLPDADARRVVAKAHDRPVLMITRRNTPVAIEEPLPRRQPHGDSAGEVRRDRATVGPTRMLCEGSLHDYPTLDISLAQKLRTFHFDTGADASFLRVSQVREHGVELPIDERVSYSSEYGNYYAYELPRGEVQCILLDQATGGSLGVTIEGYAVEPFRNWTHARRCHENGCQLGDYGEPCLVRSGLIGRSLLTDNELAIQVSGGNLPTRVTRLKKERPS